MDSASTDVHGRGSVHYAEAMFSHDRDFTTSPVANHAESDEQGDIYRGEPPSPPNPPPRPPSVANSSSSSSSSSGWSGLGLRRGALGAVLELAINRWARATSGSSTSSSSSSSSSSIHTRIHRRRKSRTSVATSHNNRSEYIIRARRKAREESRVLPREFVLFLPIRMDPHNTSAPSDIISRPSLASNQDRRIFHTTSLPLVLTRLDGAIKRSMRARKPKMFRTRNLSPDAALLSKLNDYMLPESSSQVSRAEIPRKGPKGKEREPPEAPEPVSYIFRTNDKTASLEGTPRRPAWWLDVSSPNWSDLREIGKLLHLHPLTLEDILQQDPREKLEIFPRLGYYFIVFRALESEASRTKTKTQLDLNLKNDDMVQLAEGTIDPSNMYIVVFREGICTFHFEDVSDHISRVRNRIIQLEESFHMTSDWIAHGILDSIVDQFFPLLNSIEQEVKDLDDLVLSFNGSIPVRTAVEIVQNPTSDISQGKDEEKLVAVDSELKEKARTDTSNCNDKPILTSTTPTSFHNGIRTAGCVRHLPPLSFFPNGRLNRLWRTYVDQKREATVSTISPLRRMASTRRLVTSLTRLLGTKSEVVSQIRKRLSGGVVMGLQVGPQEQALAAEVGIYLGDIHDHIITLQQSLVHYERMLSHSHPAYLSHLRVSLSQAKGGTDKALLMLTVVTLAVLAMQLVCGVFSVNLGKIPRNRIKSMPPTPIAPFNGFIAVVAGVILTGVGIVCVSRYWWLQAKRKYARRRSL